MKAWTFVLALLLSLSAFAQDQLIVRVNEQGFMKILAAAVRSQTLDPQNRSAVIPANIYKFTIPKSKLLSNSIVVLINEISNLNMNSDLDLYLNTSEIKIAGTVDEKSLKAQISNSSDKGFDVEISINLPNVTVKADSLSLCEDRVLNKPRCGEGLKAVIGNLNIKTISRPVVVTAVLRLRTDNNVARVKVISVKSNLDASNAPALDVNNFSLTIPKVSLVINGQETELDTSRLYAEMRKKEKALSKQLLGFAAEFVAEDLAAVINRYLVKEEIQTSWQIYQGENFGAKSMPRFDDFLNMRDAYSNRAANTYYKPNTLATKTSPTADKDFKFKGIIEKLVKILKKSQLGIQTRHVSTPFNKDIQIGADVNYVLNRENIFVRPYLANSNTREIPVLSMDGHRKNDISVAVSEPLINGFFDLLGQTDFLDSLIKEELGLNGVYFSYTNKLRLHLTARKSMVIVANLRIDLSKVDTDGIGGWFENQVGQILEINKTHGIINFPLQIELIPSVYRNRSGGVELDVFIKSPFVDNCGLSAINTTDGDCGKTLINEYKYPTNIFKAHAKVRNGIIAKIKKATETSLGRAYHLDISQFLNHPKFQFTPMNITFEKEAYIVIDADIKKIDLDKDLN